MEKLVQRVRGVLHLMLIWSLVLFWVATVEPIDLYRLTWDLERDFLELVRALPKKVSPPDSAFAELRQQLDRHRAAQNPIWRSSLLGHSDGQPPKTARDYLAKCDQTLASAREIIQFQGVNVSTAKTAPLLQRIENHLERLRWHAKPELGPLATLAEVVQAARPKITIPGAGQSVPMAAGVAMSILGLTCVYLYLVSLLRALRESLAGEDPRQVADLVFFHPGWLGPTLGFCWLSVPLAGLIAAGSVIFGSQAVNSVSQLAVYCAPLLPAAWLWSCQAAWRTRAAAFRARQQEQSVSTVEFQRPRRTYRAAG